MTPSGSSIFSGKGCHGYSPARRFFAGGAHVTSTIKYPEVPSWVSKRVTEAYELGKAMHGNGLVKREASLWLKLI
ncbi:hypothetical protein L596_005450 [Steinernema carpocapsae]|uniref:Uncharacterized protein n=1 Tax=Steinernema carpocapsae TaxID=34508 RepID=A0A4U8V0M5_STECR|nr:hypothetical protein L596_005450 [Steinernema carpocapsae]